MRLDLSGHGHPRGRRIPVQLPLQVLLHQLMSNCAGLAQGGQEAILPCHLGAGNALDALFWNPMAVMVTSAAGKSRKISGATMTSAPGLRTGQPALPAATSCLS